MKNNIYIVPLAIIIAGALIGGGLAYGLAGTDSGKQTPPAANQQNEADVSLPALAQRVGLNMDGFNACVGAHRYASRINADLQEVAKVGGDGTPYTVLLDGKGNAITIRGAQPYEQLKVLLDAVLANRPIPQPYVSQKSAIRSLEAGDHIRGAAKAPITMVEYSDFQCPFCKRFHPTMQRIMKDYDGKVSWVYRNFPLSSIHQYAQARAEAAECASEQGKFWEYADALFGG